MLSLARLARTHQPLTGWFATNVYALTYPPRPHPLTDPLDGDFIASCIASPVQKKLFSNFFQDLRDVLRSAMQTPQSRSPAERTPLFAGRVAGRTPTPLAGRGAGRGVGRVAEGVRKSFWL